MLRFVWLLIGFLAAFLPARAENAPTIIQATPAMWTVRTDLGTAYLFGSMHLLPANVVWRTKKIDQAIRDADAFVFEIPVDAGTIAKMLRLVSTRGSLPEGQNLRAMVPADLQANYDKALTVIGLPEAAAAKKRPWLFTYMLDMAMLKKHMKGYVHGPDFVLMAEAKKAGKELRYLETADTQIALIAPEDPKIELQYFLADLKSLDDAEGDVAAVIASWTAGDPAGLDALIKKGFAELPQAQSYFFTDRNRAMADKLAVMLKEDKTFFVTVGAGHLTGSDGIPALLRAKGFTVEGP